ncbi:MAG: hypothetical protein RQ899_12975 [Pseudomonadales bacterium]|nr:hypothetical protein [Pseudomonadales bacterium]
MEKNCQDYLSEVELKLIEFQNDMPAIPIIKNVSPRGFCNGQTDTHKKILQAVHGSAADRFPAGVFPGGANIRLLPVQAWGHG